MIPFLQQLATQTGLRIQGQPTPPASAQNHGPAPARGPDIVEIEEIDQSSAELRPRHLPNIQQETETGPLRTRPSPESISDRQEERSRSATDSSPTPSEKPGASRGEPKQDPSAQSHHPTGPSAESPASLSAQDTPPHDPQSAPSAAASLHAVFKWIQEGEAQREVSSDVATRLPDTPASSDKRSTRDDTISSRPTQDVQTAARETTGRQPEAKPASTSPAAAVPAQRKAVSEKATPAPTDNARRPDPAHEPPIPSITIGSVQISVDAPPQPQPASKRNPQYSRPAPRSAPNSSNMYLRRHYIVPH